MDERLGEGYGPLATLTHARLRAGQGDVRGARRVLREILARAPGDAAVTELLEELTGRAHRPSEPRPVEQEPQRLPAAAGGLAGEFRRTLGPSSARRPIERLERWLRVIERRRGQVRARPCSPLGRDAKV